MKTSPYPAQPSDADTEQYDKAIREIFPDPEAEMLLHRILWEKMKKDPKPKN